jgi:hypothetical protein
MTETNNARLGRAEKNELAFKAHNERRAAVEEAGGVPEDEPVPLHRVNRLGDHPSGRAGMAKATVDGRVVAIGQEHLGDRRREGGRVGSNPCRIRPGWALSSPNRRGGRDRGGDRRGADNAGAGGYSSRTYPDDPQLACIARVPAVRLPPVIVSRRVSIRPRSPRNVTNPGRG